MFFIFNEKELRKNPCVYKVDQRKLILRTDFRIELYKLWRNGELEKIEQKLLEKGLGPEAVGADYGKDLLASFKNSGYPVYKSDELTFSPEKMKEHPLIASGKFELMEHGGNRFQINEGFKRELLSRFPEISVEEGMRLAGLDPIDVGYQRILRLQREFESRQTNRFYSRNTNDRETKEWYDNPTLTEFKDEEEKQKDLFRHPYVQDYDGNTVTLTESFYNEAYLISEIGVERLLDVYELPAEYFDRRDMLIISAKLQNWKLTGTKPDEANVQVCRIWRERLRLMTECIETDFAKLHTLIPGLGITDKRRIAEWVAGLPRDPWKKYTTRRILEIIGMPRSTYYELLHNENYGTGARRREMRDDEDILLIRQVAEYKGYKKGYRQISMMLEDVTGKTLSPHRVLYLMRKYGMRTNIRKPSKNRKAMKELMKRNGKPNILMRRFRLHRPNEVRLTDVTYLDYGDDQRAYGSASIDPVTGRLICFVVSENNDLQLALDTLEAMDEYPLKSGGIIHSDQGILYFTDDFQASVKERDLIQSMSRRGNCWDNAPQESFFGHFKDECDYKKCSTLKELQTQIDDYRVYYNGMRRIWDHGRMTPLEYEAYLDGLDDKGFKEYLKIEEAAYLKKKEKSAQAAVEKAKGRKKAIQERLEEIENEAVSKAEI